MAGRGPTPRRRSVVTIPADARAKDPPPLPDAERYSDAVRRWYQTWIETPQSSVFTSSEWQCLHMLAPLVGLYDSKPSASLHAEIRVSEAKLGATREDRIRLGWFIEGEGSPQPDDEADEAPAVLTGSSRDRPDPRRRALR